METAMSLSIQQINAMTAKANVRNDDLSSAVNRAAVEVRELLVKAHEEGKDLSDVKFALVFPSVKSASPAHTHSITATTAEVVEEVKPADAAPVAKKKR
jgi:hypothetical protein